jgi:hypothetical protein
MPPGPFPFSPSSRRLGTQWIGFVDKVGDRSIDKVGDRATIAIVDSGLDVDQPDLQNRRTA